jgi:hypothetical protein
MSVSVSLDRSNLPGAPAPLVIPGSAPAGDGLFLILGGLFEPQFDVRYTYAPDSAYVAGSQLLTAVLAASTLPVGVGAKASSTAALAALQAELAAATYQFAYTVTLTVDGVARSWDAGPSWPAWGELTSWVVDAYMARGNVVIPINP